MSIDFPREVSRAFRRHPGTGRELELLRVIYNHLPGPSSSPLPEFVFEKAGAEGSSPGAFPLDFFGWEMDFEATGNQGLVIRNVRYNNIYYLFRMLVPWLARGGICDFSKQVCLDRLMSGPLVMVFRGGFMVWAEYKLRRGAVEQCFVFLQDGTFYPLMQYTGDKKYDYVPIYMDFDIIASGDNYALNFHPWPVLNTKNYWHLAVAEYSRLGADLTPLDAGYNIILESRRADYRASARVWARESDRAVQYVSRWLGYLLDAHPLLSLRGLEIVQQDNVYTYLMQGVGPGLYGPRVDLVKERIPA